eukprot:349597-Pelagomonas_calceolata.AAC.1
MRHGEKKVEEHGMPLLTTVLCLFIFPFGAPCAGKHDVEQEVGQHSMPLQTSYKLVFPFFWGCECGAAERDVGQEVDEHSTRAWCGARGGGAQR